MGFLRRVYNSDLARRAYRTTVGRFVYHAPGELYRWLRGRRNPLIPPMWEVYTGRGDYEEIGRQFLGYFRELGDLQPDSRVLDIGSGMGRMAVPLTAFLSGRGHYTGLEIVQGGVRWCQRHITRRHPNFEFLQADIQNDLYNKKGSHAPESYRLPFGDRSFDFVFLTSVFTHMSPAAVANYLREIARVLDRGKRCLFTCSIMDDTNKALVASGRSTLNFAHFRGDHYALSDKGHTCDVAFEEQWIRDNVAAAGMALVEPIHFGAWSGREAHLSHQDIVVVEAP